MSSVLTDLPDLPEALRRNWWLIALRGVLAILMGLAAIFFTGATMGALVLLFGAYMLVDGVFGIAAGVRAARKGERWVLLILEGIAGLVAGAGALILPGLTLIVLIYVLAAWAVVSGVLLAAAGFRLTKGKWWMIAAGVLSAIWGVLLFIAPIAGAVVLTWWLGGYALAFGVLLLILAFRVRRLNREPVGRTLPA
jgi:uncharacterized membrane protein HdeD (DUF308 family)